jgi:hypothetical protein
LTWAEALRETVDSATMSNNAKKQDFIIVRSANSEVSRREQGVESAGAASNNVSFS